MQFEEFLQEHRFEPVRVVSFSASSQDNLEATIEIWWRQSEEPELGTREHLTLRLLGVEESEIQMGRFDFEIDHEDELSMSKEDPLLWKYGQTADIFMKTPLPDSARFFAEFHDLLRCDLGVNQDPISYLRRSYEGWRELVASQSYRLLSAPIRIAESATALLDAQSVDYRLLRASPPGDQKNLCVVYLGHSWVICEEVLVEVSVWEG